LIVKGFMLFGGSMGAVFELRYFIFYLRNGGQMESKNPGRVVPGFKK